MNKVILSRDSGLNSNFIRIWHPNTELEGNVYNYPTDSFIEYSHQESYIGHIDVEIFEALFGTVLEAGESKEFEISFLAKNIFIPEK